MPLSRVELHKIRSNTRESLHANTKTQQIYKFPRDRHYDRKTSKHRLRILKAAERRYRARLQAIRLILNIWDK